jgi:hypothetical protein
MEGLILPLSPLNATTPDNGNERKQAVAMLACHIASLACSSVQPAAATVAPPPNHPVHSHVKRCEPT